MNRLAFLLMFFVLCAPAFAQTVVPDLPLENAEQEARARNVFYAVRCAACQSESIADSKADVARDMRVVVRGLVRDGRSDEEITRYLASRYGDAILMRPPLRSSTLLLWFGPLLMLLCACWLALRYFKKGATHAV